MENNTPIFFAVLILAVIALAWAGYKAFNRLTERIYLLAWGLIPPPPPAQDGLPTEDDTLNVLKSALQGLHAEIQNTEGKVVFAKFQGENFIFEVVDSAEIRVIDSTWFTLPVDDIEQLSVLKTAINRANICVPATIFYTISKDTGEVYVQSQKLVYLSHEIPQLPDYLQRELTYMLYAHHILRDKVLEVQNENA